MTDEERYLDLWRLLITALLLEGAMSGVKDPDVLVAAAKEQLAEVDKP